MRLGALVAVAVAGFLAGCQKSSHIINFAKPPVAVAKASSCTPGLLGQPGCVVPAACHAQAGGMLPDPRCTPGALNAAYTGSPRFCDPAYRTRMDRPPVSFTAPLKLRLLAAYGIPASEVHGYELDHLIPLTAGGAPADPANLWPEPWDGPQGAHVKDQKELALHRVVCSPRAGDVSLVQQAFAADWRK